MRIGILGGSFDPVHLGHLGVATTTADVLGLDRVWLMPAAQAPLRDRGVHASGQQRLEMLNLALDEILLTTGEKRLELCELEIQRGGMSYTVDTLRELRILYPEHAWTWIVGEDQFARLAGWREPEILAELAEWAVFARPGHEPAAPPKLPGLCAHRVESERVWSISSTVVRQRLRAGEAVVGMVPDKVIEYIRQNRMYVGS